MSLRQPKLVFRSQSTLCVRPAASGFESPSLAKDIDLANDMGLFLQKTNIIRDYLVGLGKGIRFGKEMADNLAWGGMRTMGLWAGIPRFLSHGRRDLITRRYQC